MEARQRHAASMLVNSATGVRGASTLALIVGALSPEVVEQILEALGRPTCSLFFAVNAELDEPALLYVEQQHGSVTFTLCPTDDQTRTFGPASVGDLVRLLSPGATGPRS